MVLKLQVLSLEHNGPVSFPWRQNHSRCSLGFGVIDPTHQNLLFSKWQVCLDMQIDPDFLFHFFAVKCKMEKEEEAWAKTPPPYLATGGIFSLRSFSDPLWGKCTNYASSLLTFLMTTFGTCEYRIFSAEDSICGTHVLVRIVYPKTVLILTFYSISKFYSCIHIISSVFQVYSSAPATTKMYNELWLPRDVDVL